MGTHPVNLAFRFLLELSALAFMGLWGWRQRDDGVRIVIALAIPSLAASLWGVFAVPSDPTRSGSAPVPVPGTIRLALECGFFAYATWALADLGFTRLAAIFGTCAVLHYLLSYDRIAWLVRQ
ncbi:MAG: YrdB family protein [Acidobacteriota bacterium]